MLLKVIQLCMSNKALTHLNSRPFLFDSFYTIMQLYFLKHRYDHVIYLPNIFWAYSYMSGSHGLPPL